MNRVMVLGAEGGELVIVVLSAHGAGAEMVHVDEAEVAAARDAAAVVVAQGDALAGGLGQRPELEAAVRRDRAHKPAGPLRAEKLGDGLGDCAHVGRVLRGFGDRAHVERGLGGLGGVGGLGGLGGLGRPRRCR